MKECADNECDILRDAVGSVRVCRLSKLLIASCALASARCTTRETSECCGL